MVDVQDFVTVVKPLQVGLKYPLRQRYVVVPSVHNAQVLLQPQVTLAFITPKFVAVLFHQTSILFIL